MALQLDKIDSAPILGTGMPFEFMQWIWVLIDSLNENIDDLEGIVSSFTAIEAPAIPAVVNQVVDINSVYVPTNPTPNITNFTLPAVVDVGTRVEIDGQGSGGWSLLTAVGQTIQLPITSSTAVTSVSSSNQYDSISIICVVANTTWIVVSQSTAGFVIV